MDSLASLSSDFSARFSLHLKDTTKKLAASYIDLGLSPSSMSQRFEEITKKALTILDDACDSASEETNALKTRIVEELREIQEIKSLLGDEDQDVELQYCLEESNQPRARVTLSSLLFRADARLDHYASKKADRMTTFSQMSHKLSGVKNQLGITAAEIHSPTIVDLSAKTLDCMRAEQEDLLREKERRLTRMDALISEADHVCAKLGEESFLSSIHHTLSVYHAKNSDEATSSVDLSDGVLTKLSEKIKSLHLVAAHREQEVEDLASVLTSLFSVLERHAESATWTEIEAALSGSSRLWPSTKRACHDELHRLEAHAGKEMKDLIVSKAKEIELICASSHLLTPDLSQLLGDMNGNAGLVLSKIMRILTDTEELAQSRAPIVLLVDEAESVRTELEWLALYESDSNRYKGRDVNKNIARAARAQSLRLNAPFVLTKTRQSVHEWNLKEGTEFLFYGQDYAKVLSEISEAVERALAEKQGGPKSFKSVLPQPIATRSGQKPALPNMSLSLNKRHSIAIIDSGSSGGKTALRTSSASKAPAPRLKAVSGSGRALPSSNDQLTPGSDLKPYQTLKTPSPCFSGSVSARSGSVFSGNPTAGLHTPVSKLRDLGADADISGVVEAIRDQSVKQISSNNRSRIPRPS